MPEKGYDELMENFGQRPPNQPARPCEKHDTAAWANKKRLKPVSNVSVPDEIQVRNAKEWVDSNEK